MTYNPLLEGLKINKLIKLTNTYYCQGCRAIRNIIHSSYYEEFHTMKIFHLIKNGIATLEDSLAVTYKTKYSFPLQSSNHTPKTFI